MIEKKQFLIDDKGNVCWGIIITPDVPGIYNIIAFAPGDGQKGNSTKETLDQLYENGSPLALARDGKLPEHIVVGLQGINGSGITAAQYGYALKNSIFPKYRTKYLMATGLSLGAEWALEFAGNRQYNELPVLTVAMSTPSINTDIVDWTGLQSLVLFIHGDLDKGLTDYNNSIRIAAQINAIKPGYAYVIIKKGIGHGGWAEWYAPGARLTIGDHSFKDLYDLLQYVGNTETYFFPTGSDTSLPPNTSSMATAKLSVKVTDTTAEFDPTGTVGASSWNLELRDVAGVYYKPNWSGLVSGNFNPSKPADLPVANNIKAGAWTAVFTVQPGNVVVKIPVVVGIVTPPVVTKTAIAIIPNAKTGNTTIVYDNDETEKKKTL